MAYLIINKNLFLINRTGMNFVCSIRGKSTGTWLHIHFYPIAARCLVSLGCSPQTEVACCHGFCSQDLFYPCLFQDFSKSQSSWEISQLCLVLWIFFLGMVFSFLRPTAYWTIKGSLLLRLEKEKGLSWATYLYACPLPARTMGKLRKQEALALIWVLTRNTHGFPEVPKVLQT